VSVAVYHFQDNVGHLIALKVAEVVLRVCDLWYRVFHLNVEANMRGKIFEDLLVCSCVSVNMHRRKLLVFPTAAALLQATAVHTQSPPHYQHTHVPAQELEMFFFPEVLQNMIHATVPGIFQNPPPSYSKTTLPLIVEQIRSVRSYYRTFTAMANITNSKKGQIFSGTIFCGDIHYDTHLELK